MNKFLFIIIIIFISFSFISCKNKDSTEGGEPIGCCVPAPDANWSLE